MRRIITFSVKHPVTILMSVVALLIFGIISIYFMNIDFLPLIQKRKLFVTTEYEGISAKEIKTLVTVPLEDSFSSLGGMKKITSVSRDGLSLITIELHYGTDIDLALVESREIIDQAFISLPSMCSKPQVKSIESINETLTVAMIPLDNDLTYGRYIADYDVKARFQRISGVGSVNISGGEKDCVEIRVEKDKLDSLKLTINNVAEMISSSNFEFPAGTITEGENLISVKTSGLYTDTKQIEQTPILYNEGGLLRVSDIGDVVETVEEKNTFFLYNGKECIRIGIKKKNNASPLAVSKNVNEELVKLNEIYGNYYRFEIVTDLSLQIRKSILSLFISGIVGAVVAACVIYIFLRSVMVSFILASVIPICSLVSLFILCITGKSINIMSLSGLAIGIGMVIDCSAVVIENVQKKSIEKRNNIESKEQCKEIIIEAVGEVLLSNFGSTITTIVVFVPIFFLKGILGELFIDLAIAIISSIGISCILSITYIPALCGIFTDSLVTVYENPKNIRKLEEIYKNILTGCFKRKYVVVSIVTATALVGVMTFSFIDFELLPTLNSNVIEAEIIMDADISLNAMYEKALAIQNDLQVLPNVLAVVVTGGIEEDNYEKLVDPGLHPEILSFSIRTNGAKNAEADINKIFEGLRYTNHISNKTDLLSEILEINEDKFILTAESGSQLYEKARKIVDKEENIIPNQIKTEYTFVPDRVANARYSISALSVASLAYYYLEGVEATPFYKEGREIPIYVKLKKDNINSIEDLKNSYIQMENNIIPFRALGKFELRENEKSLYRYNRKDAKIILNPLEQQDELLSLKKMDIEEMLGDGAFLILVVILLLYLVLGAQFESFKIPILLMIALPPAFSGAFGALLIFRQTLNINSIIALVILFGTSINNTILLYEACKKRKIISPETIITDSTRKLRSILITNLTTICAVIPFAIDINKTNAQSSLSIAIIGGLIISVMLVLFVIPVLFSKVLTTPGNRNE